MVFFQDLSNSKSLSNKATSTDSLLRAVPASPRKNAAETYAQEMARFEKANWSTGSGTVKNFALETAQLRVKELTYENEDLRKEKEHYYQTAFKWKGEAKM